MQYSKNNSNLLTSGEDCDKKAEEGDMLTAEFHGFLANGHDRFESSHDSKKPSSFKIGHGYMIKGLERGEMRNIN